MKKYLLPQVNQHIETVILANGDFPKHAIPLSILHKAEYVVCCDGAINNLTHTNIIPNAIVGDCDSLSAFNQERFKDIIHRSKEQDTNDLTKAMKFCLDQGRNKITILGATGKREDHTIGNIALLSQYAKWADVEMITDHGSFIAIEENSEFECYIKQQVSLFCLDHCHITTHNLLYEVKNRVFESWWQATLNEAISNNFGIDTDGRTIIYRLF